jgi:hypothetical protein
VYFLDAPVSSDFCLAYPQEKFIFLDMFSIVSCKNVLVIFAMSSVYV